MPFTNCKAESKFTWTKFCVLSAPGNDNGNDNDMLIVSLFLLSKTQNYMFLLQFYRQEKNQNFLAKDLKDFLFFLYWNEYKTKSENKNTTNEYRYILESNFTGINRLFTLVYLNRNNDVNQFDPRRYYLPKGIIKN